MFAPSLWVQEEKGVTKEIAIMKMFLLDKFYLEISKGKIIVGSDKEPWASYIWNWKCSGGFLPSGITRCKLDRDANKTKSHLNRPL